MSRIEIDRYLLFVGIVLGGLGLLTIGMLAIAIWLFRRNRRLPRLVKPRRRPGRGGFSDDVRDRR